MAALGCSVLMEIGPQPVLTGGCGPGLAGAPAGAARHRLDAQGRGRPAPDRRRAGLGLRRRSPTRFHRAASSAPVAGSNCRPIRSSVGASGPREAASSAPAWTVPMESEFWAVRKTWPLAIPCTPAGCPSNPSRGCWRPRHLRHRRRPRGHVRGHGTGRGRYPGTGQGRVLLRADHPAREELSRGAADVAPTGRRAVGGSSRCTAVPTGTGSPTGR